MKASKTKTPEPITKTYLGKINDPEQVPHKLMIRDGKLVTLDGREAVFDLPEGTLVNVIERADTQKIVAMRLRREARYEEMMAITKAELERTEENPKKAARKPKKAVGKKSARKARSSKSH